MKQISFRDTQRSVPDCQIVDGEDAILWSTIVVVSKISSKNQICGCDRAFCYSVGLGLWDYQYIVNVHLPSSICRVYNLV